MQRNSGKVLQISLKILEDLDNGKVLSQQKQILDIAVMILAYIV